MAADVILKKKHFHESVVQQMLGRPLFLLTQTLKQPNEGIEMSLWQPGTTINVINVTFYITLKIIEPTV